MHVSFSQYATGEDVLFHWNHHGNIPGRILTQDPTSSADPDSPHGKSERVQYI